MPDAPATTIEEAPEPCGDPKMIREHADFLEQEIRFSDADAAWLRAAAAEIEDLRSSVVAFGAPYAVRYAKEHGLPRGHLFAIHYDILARAGARMDDFTRSEVRRG